MLPPELEKAFAELERKIENRHRNIKESLNNLRTLVIGHYQDVNNAVKTLETKVIEQGRQHVLLKQEVENVRGRLVKVETHTGLGPTLPA